MSKTFTFTVEIEVDEDVMEDRAIAFSDALLQELLEDERYLDVTLLRPEEMNEDAMLRLMDMLRSLEPKDIADAIESAERLEDDDG